MGEEKLKIIRKVGGAYFSGEEVIMEESLSQHTGKTMKVNAFLRALTITLLTFSSCKHGINDKREIKFNINLLGLLRITLFKNLII